MAEMWKPVPILLKISIRNQARVSAAIASARAQVPHRGFPSNVGGSLVPRSRSRKILDTGKAHVATQWSKLGPALRFFIRGTPTQRRRTVKLNPKRSDVLEEVEADAFAHFEMLERQRRDDG